MYILFKKDHEVGIAKGHCSITTDKAGNDFIENGYAKEITEKEYQEWKEEWRANNEKKAKEATKKAEKVNAKREFAQEVAPEEEESEEEASPEIEEYELTKDDLTTYPDLTRGMKEGDKVQSLDGVKTVGANGLFVLVGNSEGSENGPGTSEEDSKGGGDGATNTGEVEKIYHALVEEDLKAHPELTDGMALGAEVEVDSDNNFVIVDDKLVVKPVKK